MFYVTFGLGDDLDRFLRLGLYDKEAGEGSYVVLGQGQDVRRFLLLGLLPAGVSGSGGSYITLGTGQNVYLHVMLGLTPAGLGGFESASGQVTETYTIVGTSYRQIFGFGLGADDVQYSFTVSGAATITGPPVPITATAGRITWQGRVASIEFPGGQNIAASAASQLWTGNVAQIGYVAGMYTSPGLQTWAGSTATIYGPYVVEASAGLVRWQGAKAIVSGTNLPRVGGRIRIIRGKRYLIYGG